MASQELTSDWLSNITSQAYLAKTLTIERLRLAGTVREVEGLVLTWQQLNIATAALSSAKASFDYSIEPARKAP